MSTDRYRLSRRELIAGATAAMAGLAINTAFERVPAAAANAGPPMSADAALDLLMAGNRRFVGGACANAHRDAARRGATAGGQHPFAVVLGCSDSRVAPEVVFDQGIGDIFTIRAAGNVADRAGIGSIQYAVAELKAPLLVVLGHEKCGAVGAAIQLVKQGTTFPGDIQSLAVAIAPAVRAVAHASGDVNENAMRANVKLVVQQLSAAPILRDALAGGKLKIVGARYGLASGRVTLI